MDDTHYTNPMLSHIAVQWFKAQVFMKDFSNFKASDIIKIKTGRAKSPQFYIQDF